MGLQNFQIEIGTLLTPNPLGNFYLFSLDASHKEKYEEAPLCYIGKLTPFMSPTCYEM